MRLILSLGTLLVLLLTGFALILGSLFGPGSPRSQKANTARASRRPGALMGDRLARA